MESSFAALACYLLLIPLAAGQTIQSHDLNTTHTPATTLPSGNSTGHIAANSNSTTDKTSTDWTAATLESSSRLQTSQATTSGTSQTNGTTATPATPGTPTSTQTTAGYVSTPDATVITTESSSHAATTQGLGLNMSDKTMTAVFSVVLGGLGLAVVVFTLHKCRHKIQYLHQPLDNTDDFVADDDTLVISGGLYDGHPIYDNVPAASEDQSQFHLQFFH